MSHTSDVYAFWNRHVSNNGKDPNLADNPKKATVWISADSIFPMDTLARIITQIQLSHQDFIKSYAEAFYSKPFCELPIDTVTYLKEEFPLLITYSRNRADLEVPLPPPPPLTSLPEF